MAASYDAIVIGGGPAGLSTALHVHAHAPTLRALVLEAERYPREKICAGGIGGRGLHILERLGIAIDCPMVSLDAIALRYAGETAIVREPGLGVVVRRVEFDHALAKQVAARGIEVRDGCRVTAIVPGDDGVRVALESGEQLVAKVVVGADGVAGITRRAIGLAPSELRAQVVELDTPATPHDLPRDTAVFDFTASDLAGYAWDFPTLVGGRELVCRGAYVIHNLGADSPRARIGAYLAARGLDVASFKLKQYAERGYQPGAPIAVPRVLLVGEAAGIDIATGEGIAQAIEYGALAGRYLARAFEVDDLGFASWRGHVARHHVGWQLWIRHVCYRAFYGGHRATLERILPRATALLRLGVRDFAGKPLSALALVHGAGQVIRALAAASAAEPT
ncbi:MAG TPA: NAD(P)/FAD-dependent oxidoreductase [Kofleriaceae bacterium]|jgi:flavin-dependent dehydrogenase